MNKYKYKELYLLSFIQNKTRPPHRNRMRCIWPMNKLHAPSHPQAMLQVNLFTHTHTHLKCMDTAWVSTWIKRINYSTLYSCLCIHALLCICPYEAVCVCCAMCRVCVCLWTEAHTYLNMSCSYLLCPSTVARWARWSLVNHEKSFVRVRGRES